MDSLPPKQLAAMWCPEVLQSPSLPTRWTLRLVLRSSPSWPLALQHRLLAMPLLCLPAVRQQILVPVGAQLLHRQHLTVVHPSLPRLIPVLGRYFCRSPAKELWEPQCQYTLL